MHIQNISFQYNKLGLSTNKKLKGSNSSLHIQSGDKIKNIGLLRKLYEFKGVE